MTRIALLSISVLDLIMQTAAGASLNERLAAPELVAPQCARPAPIVNEAPRYFVGYEATIKRGYPLRIEATRLMKLYGFTLEGRSPYDHSIFLTEISPTNLANLRCAKSVMSIRYLIPVYLNAA